MPHQPLLPELLHLLHHARHVLILLQEAVDIRHRGARARRDPPAARAVQQLRVFALGFGHRGDDCFLTLDDRLVDIRRVELLLDLADPGKHAEHAAHSAHAAQLPQLRGEIVEIEIALLEFLGEPLGLVAVGGLGGALDQGDDVAHSENAAGDALGMKRLERVNLFAGADHDNRLPGDRPHRQRGAATRIAIDPGQHDAGDAGPLAKGLCNIDGVLAGHRIGDEEGLVRCCGVAHRRHFQHQLLIDMEPPGGVEDDDVVAFAAPGFEGAAGDRHRPLAGDDRQGRNAGLASELRQLLLRRGALHVERGHQHFLALAVLQAQRNLGCGCRFARALQPDQHDPDRRGRVKVKAPISANGTA